MAPRRKPLETLRQRGRRGEWTALPERCDIKPPAWPMGAAAAAEKSMWAELWTAPIACWWHAQHVSPRVIGRYVRLAITKPELATLSRMESDLGLTPASMDRLRLVVAEPEPKPEKVDSPYAHLKEVV